MKIIFSSLHARKLDKSTQKRLFFLLKILIALLAFWAIYARLSGQVNQADLKHFILSQIRPSFYLLVVCQVVLMLGAFYIEAMRWRSLIYHLEPISKWIACKAVLAGVPVGIFTPNRVGDIAGRLFFVRASNRIRGVVVTAIGAFAQTIVFLLCGLCAFIIFAVKYLQLQGVYLYVLLYLAVVVLFLLFLLFFNVAWLSRLADNVTKNEKIHKILEVLASYSRQELCNVLLMSLLRYLVATTQYACFLYYLVGNVEFFSCMQMVSLIFLVQTIVPTFAMADLGIRGATSLYFMSFLHAAPIPVLASSFLIWCINIMLPAIIGLTFVIEQKYGDSSDGNS